MVKVDVSVAAALLLNASCSSQSKNDISPKTHFLKCSTLKTHRKGKHRHPINNMRRARQSSLISLYWSVDEN